MFSRLSRETLYRRFHAPYPMVPEWALDRLLGVERYNGESVVVEDSWQSKGVGKLLISELGERAKQRGIQFFTCTVLGENRRALDFFLAAFSKVRCELKDGTYLLRATLAGGLESTCCLAGGRGREEIAAGTVVRAISKGGSQG